MAGLGPFPDNDHLPSWAFWPVKLCEVMMEREGVEPVCAGLYQCVGYKPCGLKTVSGFCCCFCLPVNMSVSHTILRGNKRGLQKSTYT